MSKEHFLTLKDIQENILKLKNFMRSNKLDSFYISTNDIFLNEYVPLPDCHRYYVTNFTGSTAEVIVPLNGNVILFVDGRYSEQADIEADPKLIEVYKCPYGMGLKTAMFEIIRDRGLKNLGVEGDRIDLSLFTEFSNIVNVKSFNNAELRNVIDFKTITFDKTIRELPLELVGESTLSKCQRLLNPGEAFFITALDSIAWITNLRRFELPYQSTFRAKALATRENVYLLMENIEGKVECPEIEISVGKFSELEKFLDLISEYEFTWKKFQGLEAVKIEKVFYSDRSLNAADFQKLKKHFGEELLVNRPEGLVPFHANKNPAELKSMESSFNRGDQAIFETITWLKIKNILLNLIFFIRPMSFIKKMGPSSKVLKPFRPLVRTLQLFIFQTQVLMLC